MTNYKYYQSNNMFPMKTGQSFLIWSKGFHSCQTLDEVIANTHSYPYDKYVSQLA